MSGLSPEEARGEARLAWRAEAERRTIASFASACVLALVVAVGAFTLVAVALRLALLFEGRAGAVALTMIVGTALASAIVLVPLAIVRRRRARARRAIEAARASERSPRCPRCAAALDEGAWEVRRCACGATLLAAEGLVVVHTSQARWRHRRWRAEARARLGASRATWMLSPVLWMSLTIAALAALWTTAAALGGTPPSTVDAPLALDRQVSMHATARAESEAAELPPGPATRGRAPSWVGTQVLAPRGAHHELAVIVRVDAPSAFVVYASGGSGWVRGRALLAPELARGDAVEVREGARFVPAEVIERVGPALLVERDGVQGWTSAARVRVRSDARHERGEGLESEVPPGAWIEARIGGALRPGIQVESSPDQRRVHVALSDGSARWVPREDVRAQAIDPGVRVRVDGVREPVIVAARIGDALAVVGADGVRSWTALSRVRRAVEP